MDFKVQYPASLAATYPADDPRQERWAKERQEHGFDNTELWNLDATFARLMLPRIRAYIDYTRDKVIQEEPWNDDMAKIIAALEIMGNDTTEYSHDEVDMIVLGLDAFRDCILNMWY